MAIMHDKLDTCISQHHQLTTREFCWGKVLLQLAHLDLVEDTKARDLLDGVTFTVSVQADSVI